MKKDKISLGVMYLFILLPLSLVGVFLLVNASLAEDSPIYRDGVCIDHCEEDEDDEEDEKDDEDDDDGEESSEEKTEEKSNETKYTTVVTQPARTVTTTVMKTRVIVDTDQDGLPDDTDPQPTIAKIYIVGDEDMDGIADWLDK